MVLLKHLVEAGLVNATEAGALATAADCSGGSFSSCGSSAWGMATAVTEGVVLLPSAAWDLLFPRGTFRRSPLLCSEDEPPAEPVLDEAVMAPKIVLF